MFKQLRIKNFKSLADTGDLELRPLTILVGPNSSGKSALFKALLALKQTTESRDLQSPLVVNGDYVKLGTYRDFIYRHHLSRVFSIEARLSVDNLFSDFVQRELDSSHKTSEKPLPSSTDDIGFGVEFQYNRGTQRIQVKTVSATQGPEHLLRAAWKHRGGGHEIKTPLSSGNILLNKFYLLEPEELPGSEAQLPDERMRSIRQIVLLAEFGQFIQEMFSRILYLGPLRAAPERFYIAGGETPQDVGLAGERAIEVLWMQRQLIRPSVESEAKELVAKVEEWVKKFGFSLETKFSQASPTVYEVLFVDPHTNIPVNIADVGFGASQVLPVIVEGFYSPPGCTFLVEQPEIHLHPKAQATLGDLLVDLSKHDRQVIVETHSENILLRVQRRIADETIAPSDVAIYYFDPTEKGTQIREVKLTEYGQYVWETMPEGFFNEGFTETYEFSKAILERRRQEDESAKVG